MDSSEICTISRGIVHEHRCPSGPAGLECAKKVVAPLFEFGPITLDYYHFILNDGKVVRSIFASTPSRSISSSSRWQRSTVLPPSKPLSKCRTEWAQNLTTIKLLGCVPTARSTS